MIKTFFKSCMNFRSQFCEKCIVRHTHICRELFGRCLGGLSFGSGILENLCFAILPFCTKFLNAEFENAANLQRPHFQEFTCFAICLFQDFLWPNSSRFPRGSHIYTSGSPYLTGLLSPGWKQDSPPIKCPGTFQKRHFLTPSLQSPAGKAPIRQSTPSLTPADLGLSKSHHSTKQSVAFLPTTSYAQLLVFFKTEK